MARPVYEPHAQKQARFILETLTYATGKLEDCDRLKIEFIQPLNRQLMFQLMKQRDAVERLSVKLISADYSDVWGAYLRRLEALIRTTVKRNIQEIEHKRLTL